MHVIHAGMLVLALAAAGAAAADAVAPHKPPPTIQLPAELDRVLRAYERAWSSKDAAGLARLFMTDGMALPNGTPPVLGSGAIEAHYAATSGSPLALRAFAYSVSGNLAYVIGGFAASVGEPDMGKFVLVLRRATDGRWWLIADIDNVNAIPRRGPAPPAP